MQYTYIFMYPLILPFYYLSPDFRCVVVAVVIAKKFVAVPFSLHLDS